MREGFHMETADPKHRLLAEIARSVTGYDAEAAKAATRQALDAGIAPLEALEEGLSVGIEAVGARFGCGEIFLPELVSAAGAMQAGLDVLKTRWENMDRERKVLGKVVLGTVKGDIHSIGKQIVGSLLTAAGFTTVDLGVDVAVETFVEKAKVLQPHIVGLSALLTTSMPWQRLGSGFDL
jgi:trimethylamine corrinoid protein